MNAPPDDDDEACTNCTNGTYSRLDAEGEEREYECNWCNGTGKNTAVPATTSARNTDEG